MNSGRIYLKKQLNIAILSYMKIVKKKFEKKGKKTGFREENQVGNWCDLAKFAFTRLRGFNQGLVCRGEMHSGKKWHLEIFNNSTD